MFSHSDTAGLQHLRVAGVAIGILYHSLTLDSLPVGESSAGGHVYLLFRGLLRPYSLNAKGHFRSSPLLLPIAVMMSCFPRPVLTVCMVKEKFFFT